MGLGTVGRERNHRRVRGSSEKGELEWVLGVLRHSEETLKQVPVE